MAIFVVFWSYLLTTTLKCLQKNNFGHTIQGDISTKRTGIDNLSSQMATLARYQAEKRSKNKETEEAITKLSENLARLN